MVTSNPEGEVGVEGVAGRGGGQAFMASAIRRICEIPVLSLSLFFATGHLFLKGTLHCVIKRTSSGVLSRLTLVNGKYFVEIMHLCVR